MTGTTSLDKKAVDDELASLQARVRCGEPRRRAPGEPLRARIEALAELYRTGQQRAMLERIAAERDAAGPVWSAYWDALYSGLDPDPELCREEISGRDSYRIAINLEILCTNHGQPLAKAILRDLGPRYGSLPPAMRRVVRELGRGLDPREDLDARLLLVDLLERWDIDQQSGEGFLHALSRAGLDVCLPLLERRLGTCVNDQAVVAALLTNRRETAPSAALREALREWKDPSWLVFQVVLRGDREAVGALRRAWVGLPRGGIAAQMVDLGLAALGGRAPVPASLLSTLRKHVYDRLHPPMPSEFSADGASRDTSKPMPSLSERFLEHVSRRYLGDPYDRLDELTRCPGLDPRFSPDLALVILAEAARGDARAKLRRAACHAIWNLGLIEID
ncbi:hypothetical protein [Nannocystis sp.]|uniref:hypothetical protein n=1 Tax=Nannocystis sp. TaxID=1962667 RepID=UPI0025CCD510|nr:hypothetical protein [Nannocystis sp.]MBK7829213.1 hypothetical protein [Nannocystis sp.]